MEEEELMECPICGHTEYVFERERPITIIRYDDDGTIYPSDCIKCSFFCGRCNRDF